jgi:hypothetical protein
MAETYAITQQSQSTEINPAGNGFMPVWNVSYTVTSGPAARTTGTVQVPEDQHDAATVSAAIEAKILALSEIASLGKT